MSRVVASLAVECFGSRSEVVGVGDVVCECQVELESVSVEARMVPGLLCVAGRRVSCRRVGTLLEVALPLSGLVQR